jgi:thiamine kinase-like enzyme
MEDCAIVHPDQVTPRWLSATLAQHGLLEAGEVLAVHKRPERSIPIAAARITYLQLELSAGARLSIPTQIVLKFAIGFKEPYFYETMAASMAERLWPACYLSTCNPEANSAWLLLEDLSQTHFQTRWPIPPDYERCAASLETLARLHAHWWGDPRLADEFPAHLTWEKSWQGRMALAIEKFPEFVDFMGDRLSTERRELFERILASPRRDWLPEAPTDHRTLLHGDAHFWNFLYPREATQNRICMIDWNAWDIGRAADDLAYMLALHWYPERRARFERPLLQVYYHELVENGVENYSWEALWRDYRLGAMRNLFIPAWQWVRGIHPSVWWSHLERGAMAFGDLGCEELL